MQSIVILDFGSQFTQLIARRVRELHVYCELLPHDAPRAEIERLKKSESEQNAELARLAKNSQLHGSEIELHGTLIEGLRKSTRVLEDEIAKHQIKIDKLKKKIKLHSEISATEVLNF